MAWKTWIIIILVALAFAQYSYPEKTHNLLQPLFGKLSDATGGFTSKIPFIGVATKETVNSNDLCSKDINLVCGKNGITYNNSCFASLDGVIEIKPGAC